ncbi:hypothetical protein D3C76_1743340 [compost metagenome]
MQASSTRPMAVRKRGSGNAMVVPRRSVNGMIQAHCVNNPLNPENAMAITPTPTRVMGRPRNAAGMSA